jgi:hypothetical protein
LCENSTPRRGPAAAVNCWQFEYTHAASFIHIGNRKGIRGNWVNARIAKWETTTSRSLRGLFTQNRAAKCDGAGENKLNANH